MRPSTPFKKAGEVDPNQEAVWAQLAKAYNEKADTEKKPDMAAQRAGRPAAAQPKRTARLWRLSRTMLHCT